MTDSFDREMQEALAADGEKLHALTGEDHGPFGMCDGCGAVVPIEQLCCVVFIECDGFVCEECKRDTVVIDRVEKSLTSHEGHGGGVR